MSTGKCVAFCSPDQIEMKDALLCYDKPTISISENYLSSTVSVGTSTMNIATTEFNVDVKIISNLH